MQKGDYLLRLMKQRTDAMVATDEKLQQFLMWVSQKPLSIEAPYTSAAVRAFYFSIGLAVELAIDLALVRAIHPTINPAFGLISAFAIDRGLVLDLYYAINHALNNSIDHKFYDVLDFNLVPTVYHVLEFIFYPALDNALVPELKRVLQELKTQLPDPDSDRDIVKQWWEAKGKAWTDQLRVVMIEHRNIGHNWQFSKEQRELLKQYYHANKLLIDCLNNASNVTPAVRSHIEDTLLLPIVEIEKRDASQDK
jgi:predicted NACHT family NTPase